MNRLLAFILLSGFLVSCGGDDTDTAILAIKNWSSFSSLGAGYVNSSTKRNCRSETSGSDRVAKLVGITGEGVYETITFTDKDGNEVSQDMYLSNFKAFRKYTFFQFSKLSQSTIGNFSSFASSNPCYVLYAPTGKIYSLESFENVNLYTIGCYDESDDAIFFKGKRADDAYNNYGYIYKISVEDDILKVEKKLDCSKLPDWRGVRADKYGNIYSLSAENWKSPCDYIIKTDGTLESLTGTYFKAMNGIVYSGSSLINSSGNLESATFVPDDTFYAGCAYPSAGATQSTYLIKKDGNDYYYYANSPYSTMVTSIFPGTIIIKISFQDGNKINYSYEEISLSDSSDDYVVANDNIYFLNNNEIFYVSIFDGVKHSVVSDYFFNSITSDNVANVYFTAINSQLNDVSGIIDSDGNFDLNITDNGYEILYLLPLN